MKKEFLEEIFSQRDEIKAKNCFRFYKTGKGDYAEGDIFLGLNSAQNRMFAKKYYDKLSLEDIEALLQNKYHEVRACALFAAVLKYKKGSDKIKSDVYDLYIRNADRVNNWDLVDTTAPYISGDFAYNFKKESDLLILAHSGKLWRERISIVSTLYFIKHGNLDFPLEICRYFLFHEHDLIRKASGWMLREAGKKDVKTLEKFLRENVASMPRTTLRYAIERFPENKRKSYLLAK